MEVAGVGKLRTGADSVRRASSTSKAEPSEGKRHALVVAQISRFLTKPCTLDGWEAGKVERMDRVAHTKARPFNTEAGSSPHPQNNFKVFR